MVEMWNVINGGSLKYLEGTVCVYMVITCHTCKITIWVIKEYEGKLRVKESLLFKDIYIFS